MSYRDQHPSSWRACPLVLTSCSTDANNPCRTVSRNGGQRGQQYTSFDVIELDASCKTSLSEEAHLGDDKLIELDELVVAYSTLQR